LQGKIVRERKELLSLVMDRGGRYFVFEAPKLPSLRPTGALLSVPPVWQEISLSAGDATKNPSWIRIWLGDERVAILLLSASDSSDEAARIISAFPEANVSQYTR
ncbi:MAG TPA: hypothetical protein VG056_08210, partial [Pirellulales bacterium]|nr:hypothetical protein [Pirellulales bacterium]